MRNRKPCFAPVAAAAALALAGCGGDDATETADANLIAPEGPDLAVVYPIGTAQSLEPDAMRTEVDRLRATVVADPDQAADGGQAGNQSDATANASAAGASGDGSTTGFAGLDRDNDGRLSPAEYAIYALPSETPARQGPVDDENPPYVSNESLNEVATRFSRLDTDGDFFLSQQEFEAATR